MAAPSQLGVTARRPPVVLREPLAMLPQPMPEPGEEAEPPDPDWTACGDFAVPDEAEPPDPDWTAYGDFAVPDEVQPPLPIPKRSGSRSVTGGKVLAAARRDNRHLCSARALLTPEVAGMVDRGPLQVRASCSLNLPPRILESTPRLEDPASGDATDVPRSLRSSLSSGRSCSSTDPGLEAELVADDAHNGLLKWLRSEDFSPPLSPPSAGRVQSAQHHEAVRDWPRSQASVAPLMRATLVGVEEPTGDQELCRADALDESTVGPLPSSPPLVGRGASASLTNEAYLDMVASASSSSSGAGASRYGAEVYVPALKRRGLFDDEDVDRVWPADPERVAPGPGRKAEAAEVAPEAPSIFDFLRSQFADIDVRNRRQIDEGDLVEFVCSRALQGSGGPVPEELDGLLRESARRCYNQAMVRSRGVRADDWVHYGLLLMSAPSDVSHDLLNRRLRREVTVRLHLLRQILEAFEVADVRGAGALRPEDVEEAFEKGREVRKAMDLGDQDQITYYDFAAFCLGYRKSPVVLNWYDVSYGYAQWLPTSVLGGQPLRGIWHTGMVVFGKEYWYGGKVLSSDPGNAPFPPGPVRSTHLGYTLRTREEVEDFLRYELVPRYTRDKYDILKHNCNHFSDEVAGYLVQGCHIPDEALLQPEAVMSAPLLEKFRPYLNNWLSGFDAAGCDSGIDDMMAEWRARIWPGDLALLSSHEDHHQPLQLVQVLNVDSWQGTCEVTYFESLGACRDADSARCSERDARALRWSSCAHSGSFWDWRVVQRQAVPLSALRPHVFGGRGLAGTTGAGLSGCVRAQLRITNPEMQVHLRRKGVVFAHCPQGHFIASSTRHRSWSLASKPTCGVCSKAIGAGQAFLECSACAFSLCDACDQKGLYRGYFSLGSIGTGTARLLLEETEWIRYKARRYMAAAGSPGGELEMDMWLKRVAPRLFGDLGLQVPSMVELIEMYRLHNHGPDGQPGRFVGLAEDEFCDLVFGLLTVAAVGTAAIVTL